MGNALWHLVMQSDAISKFVLLLLLFMSIICWTIFFYKLILFRSRRASLRHLLGHIKQARSLDDLQKIALHHGTTFAGSIVSAVISYAYKTLEIAQAQGHTHFRPNDVDSIENYAYQVVDDAIAQEESLLPFLSASAGIAPLLGLFGTVWGLVHAFVRISEKQTADIATIAPGIAEALVTTLAGLIVAIPALAMYVYLSTQVRGIEQLGNRLIDRIQLFLQELRG